MQRSGWLCWPAYAAAVVVCLCVCVYAAPVCSPAITAPTSTWSTQKINGAYQFVNSQLGPTRLKGVSFTGFETGTRGTDSGGGYWLFDANNDAAGTKTLVRNIMTTLVDKWKVNVIRIPVCGSGWLQNYRVHGWGGTPTIDTYKNWVDTAVCSALAKNAVVIIDLHLWAVGKETTTTWNAGIEDGCTGINAINDPNHGGWIDSCAPHDWYGKYTSTRTGKSYNAADGDGTGNTDWQCSIANADGCTLDNLFRNNNTEHFLNFWYDVAQRYKDTPWVWFEIINEPYTRKSAKFPSKPGDQATTDGKFGDNQLEADYPWDKWSSIMNQAINVIRNDAGANNIILATGLDWAYDYLGDPASSNPGPITKPSLIKWASVKNIGYTMHPYQHGACCGAIGTATDASRTDPFESAFCLYAPDNYTPSRAALPASIPDNKVCDSTGYARTQDKKAPPCLWKGQATKTAGGAQGLCAGDTSTCSAITTKAECDAVDWASKIAGGWSKHVLPMQQYGPIIATEFGSFDCSSAFAEAFMRWARMFNVSYAVWALWPQNSGGPGMGACGYPGIITPTKSSSDGYGKGSPNCLTTTGCASMMNPLAWSASLVYDDLVGTCSGASNPCKNGGQCATAPTASNPLNVVCYCEGTGFTGSTCSTPTSGAATPCVPNPCKNGGKCFIGDSKAPAQASCDCSTTAGFTGATCASPHVPIGSDTGVPVDPCAGVSCGAHGACSQGACACTDGYTGAACNIPPGTDPCTVINCGAHGTCSQGACTCTDGYTGATCTVPPDPCAKVNCGAHGSCSNGACTCTDGYTGATCNVPPPNPCANINCGAHGSCANGVCTCTDGYSGSTCTIAPTCFATANDAGSNPYWLAFNVQTTNGRTIKSVAVVKGGVSTTLTGPSNWGSPNTAVYSGSPSGNASPPLTIKVTDSAGAVSNLVVNAFGGSYTTCQ